MKAVWLTDIHINFLELKERILFYDKILVSGCDSVLISGDIAEASCLSSLLKEMAEYIRKPIYFVLGNHDYYGSEIDKLRQEMKSLTQMNQWLSWLPALGIQLLEESTILVGQDGWADGRYGDYQRSSVVLNDSRMIVDLFQQKILGKEMLLKKMRGLADSDAFQLQADINQAIDQYDPKRIIILTHVPPFKEACLYEGKISNDDYLPYFASQAIGDVLMTIANDNPSIKFLTLSGHTHSAAEYRALDNLTIKVGQARYYQPELQAFMLATPPSHK